MAADAAQAARSLSQTASSLARRWATQRLAAVQSYSRILADYGGGRTTGRAAATAWAKLALDEATRYSTDAFQLATDYASAVAGAAGLSIGADQAAASATPVIDIELSGVMGRTATRTFVLENPHASDAAIAFAAGAFHDGEQEVAAKPVFTPASVALPAFGEQAVKVSVKLDPKRFRPGRTYRAAAAVEGFDDMIVRVHLSVTE